MCTFGTPRNNYFSMHPCRLHNPSKQIEKIYTHLERFYFTVDMKRDIRRFYNAHKNSLSKPTPLNRFYFTHRITKSLPFPIRENIHIPCQDALCSLVRYVAEGEQTSIFFYFPASPSPYILQSEYELYIYKCCNFVHYLLSSFHFLNIKFLIRTHPARGRFFELRVLILYFYSCTPALSSCICRRIYSQLSCSKIEIKRTDKMWMYGCTLCIQDIFVFIL